MSAPNPVKARFYQRVSDGAWLQRVDTSGPQPSMTIAEAEAQCAAEYGFAVRCVEADLNPIQYEMLRAQRLVNAVTPPARPALLTPEQQAYIASLGRTAATDLVARKTGLLP